MREQASNPPRTRLLAPGRAGYSGSKAQVPSAQFFKLC